MAQYSILCGVPSGGTICEPSAKASYLGSLHHKFARMPHCAPNGNFSNLWTNALNAGQAGVYTHFALMHTDIEVVEEEEGKRWADILVEEMDQHDLAFISVPNAIKDIRGLTSSGIGNPSNRWNPWRRYTVKEIAKFPVTFTAEDVGYADKFLLHNNALCMFDLRRPEWYVPNADGSCRLIFNFVQDIRLVNGTWQCWQDSEDWLFSRSLWEVGVKTAITRRIKLNHRGEMWYSNYGDWGEECDKDTRPQWANDHNPYAERLETHDGGNPLSRFGITEQPTYDRIDQVMAAMKPAINCEEGARETCGAL